MDGAACVQLCSDPPIFKYKLTALTFRICLVHAILQFIHGIHNSVISVARTCHWNQYHPHHLCIFVRGSGGQWPWCLLSSPSPVMCTHVGPGLPKLVEWLLAVGADSAMLRKLSDVLQQSACRFRDLVVSAGIDWSWRSETTFGKAVMNSYRRV